MNEPKKTQKQSSREKYFALKSGYDQHTSPYNRMPSKSNIFNVLWEIGSGLTFGTVQGVLDVIPF